MKKPIWHEDAQLAGHDVTSDHFPQYGQSTVNNANKTTVFTGGNKPQPQKNQDVNQLVGNLQQTHANLRGIFSKVRNSNVFRTPQMKSAFDRELKNGIDGVGRAHAIIGPSQYQ